jgi:hypothetical protein
MLSIRSPAAALGPTSNETDIFRAVASLMRRLLISVLGLTETCDAVTVDKSKDPDELTVIVAGAPA